MVTWQKYAADAARWSDRAYADPVTYLSRRAWFVRRLGLRLTAGDTLLDLACGDGGLADFVTDLRYVGVDASPEMVAAGRRHGRELVRGDLNEYEPPTPVAATTIFRAIYYARDRRELFARIAGYTEKKLVFDLNPRQYALRDVRADLRAAGFPTVVTRPFFVPQTRPLRPAATRALAALESVKPVAALLLRWRFTVLCAALRH